MVFRKKKYLLLFIITFLSASVYILFFYTHWGVKINEEQIWKLNIQSGELVTIKNIRWIESKSQQKIAFPKQEKPFNLIFQTNFNLNNFTKLTEGIVEFEHLNTVKILINNIEYTTLHQNIILPSTNVKHPAKLPVEEYWRPKQISLNKDFLQRHLKNGNNTITLIFYDVINLEAIDCTQKTLLFLTTGQNNKLHYDFRLRKPKGSFSQSKLPILKINTHHKTILDEPKIKASLAIINNTEEGINNLSDSSIHYKIKIEVRGRTSQSFAKKSYGFTIYDKKNHQKAVKLLGLPASKKWVLYGPFADKSLIRNALTFSIYSQMGNYAPRFKFIDLVINNNYQGIYLLIEKIQISPNHINIPLLKVDQKDTTQFEGGYLLDIDRYSSRTNYPPRKDSIDGSAQPVAFSIYNPKKKKINALIEERVKFQFDVFERHIYEKDSMYKYIDINSFVDYLIITEFTKNIDGYRLSTFMYNKDINSDIPKFYNGPIWDYNFSFGLADYHEGYNPEGYVYNEDKYVPFWWKILLSDKTFSTHLKKRYQELRKTTLSEPTIFKTIDSLSTIFEDSKAINFKKWSVLEATELWPNYYLGKTHEDEINYLKSWITKRLAFLDKDILGKKGNNAYQEN
ncbi:MAG: hypothetical protein CO118_05205 [Flavobacteriales bacterium CG_4_9_14_3_um_filter_32_8]|nr:MAG: hypothetical protein CO118_05205 [Flavobacteriales bacterium CG_4_9_14_3_um_filter_32_8]